MLFIGELSLVLNIEQDSWPTQAMVISSYKNLIPGGWNMCWNPGSTSKEKEERFSLV